MFNLLNLLNVCLAADDGGTGGAGIDDLVPPVNESDLNLPGDPGEPSDPGAGDPAGKDGDNPADPTDPGVEDPAWFSQLPKEMRENADHKKALSGYKNLSDLAMAYIQNKKDLDGALRVPKKDAKPEEVKAFFTKLGVPEKEEDYELEDFDFKDAQLEIPKQIFRKVAFSSGLTKQQAKNVWLCEAAMSKAYANYNFKQKLALRDNFEPSYHKLLEAEYPVEAERTKAIKGEVDLVKSFLVETGLGQTMKHNGFIYNAEGMHSLANYIKKHTGSFVDSKAGEHNDKKIGVMGNYSQEFLKAAGKE